MDIARKPKISIQQLDLANIEALIKPSGEIYTAHLGQAQLTSRFQPIYSLSHQRVVGFEGLIRVQTANGQVLTPPALFATAETEQEAVLQDRLCRTLHIKNFINQSDSSWLFLNINPLVTIRGKQYGALFGDLLERYGIPAHRIVIEILEGQIEDEEMLAEAVSYYKSMGCLVAIDDFGAGHSNFERIWSIRPNIVKLDRSIIVQAEADRAIRRIVPRLVGLIHEAGSLVLVEGIETEEQALIAMNADVDFVQGYYFGKPEEYLPEVSTHHPVISKLFTLFQDTRNRESIEHQEALDGHIEIFRASAQAIAAGDEPATAIVPFLAMNNVDRCYLLNEDGTQSGSNFNSPSTAATRDPRFEPLGDASNAIWSRRHYFQKAIQEPGIIHISNPYLSITGGTMCVTLSMAIPRDTGTRVLCGDVRWVDS